MLNETHNIIKILIDQGLSLEVIKSLEPMNKYTDKWNWAFITTERMITTHYYDITGLLE